MSQQQKLEKVLELLINEDSDQAAELLHQLIVEKARVIYESIVDEETEEEVDEAKEDDEDDEKLDESDEVGGEPNKNFTKEITNDKAEIENDQLMNGEPEDSEEDGDEEGDEEAFGGEEEQSTEEKVEDLEAQLATLRAEFDALMGEEFQEPQHADLPGEFDSIEQQPSMEPEMDEMGMGSMFEKKKNEKLDDADKKKKEAAKKKKMDEETKFLNKTADTGQKGKAGLVGTGKNTPLGAEQDKSSFTNIPPRKDYGGKPVKFGSGTGGEYGKWNGESAKDGTPSDNTGVEPKKSSIKADTTAKYTGGKASGDGGSKSLLTKKPA